MKTPPKFTDIHVCRDMTISLLPTLAPEKRLSVAVIGPRGGVLAQCYIEPLHALTLIKALSNWVEEMA